MDVKFLRFLELSSEFCKEPEDTFFRKLCGESKRGYSQTESL